MAFRTLFVAAALASASALYDASDDVLQLTQATFDKTVLKSPGVFLVEFYAPWCGHCKNLAPEWKKAAKALKGVVSIVAVDADEHKALAGKYDVKGFPTIMLFGADKTKPTPYEGARESGPIIDFALKSAAAVVRGRAGGKGGAKAPPKPKAKASGGSGSGGGGGDDSTPGGGKSVVTLTPENFDELVLNSAEPWLIEFYAPWCGHCKSLAPEWASAAEQVGGDGVKFGAVNADEHRDLGGRFKVKGFPTIKIMPAGAKSDAEAKDYNGGRTASDLVAAAAKLSTGSTGGGKVVEVNSPAAFSEACGGKHVCVFAILPHILDDTAAKRSERLAMLGEVAASVRGKPVRVAWAAIGDHPQLEAGLNVGLLPAAYAIAGDKGVFTPYLGAFAATPLKSFAASLTTAKGASGTTKFKPGFDVLASIGSMDAWDGKDGVVPVEEPLDADL